jgi:hypothetical protein
MRASFSRRKPWLFAGLLLLVGASAAAQMDFKTDSRQAICQANWERCLGNVEGKNWKPVYDRCVKTRTSCLGGRAFMPEASPNPVGGFILEQNAGGNQANTDPATRNAACENNQPRGDRSNCVLAAAAAGYGQSFSLLGPGVPLSRIQRASSVVKCAGGKQAMFYPNGRIESCSLDNDGGLPLTDTSGEVVTCAPGSVTRFDPEGRLLSCQP